MLLLIDQQDFCRSIIVCCPFKFLVLPKWWKLLDSGCLTRISLIVDHVVLRWWELFALFLLGSIIITHHGGSYRCSWGWHFTSIGVFELNGNLFDLVERMLCRIMSKCLAKNQLDSVEQEWAITAVIFTLGWTVVSGVKHRRWVVAIVLLGHKSNVWREILLQFL